jgi:hypothetical protein
MIYEKQKQRERLLEILSEAPTEILLNAVEDFKAFKTRQAETFTTVFKYFGDGKPRHDAPPSLPAEEPSPKAETKYKFINPPHEPAGKIGSEAEASALAWLRNGPADLKSLAVAMKRNEALAGPLLARLVIKKKIAYRSDKLYCIPE